MTLEQLIERIKEILDTLYFDRENDDSDYFSYEIYCDYRDELSEKTVAELLESDNPREAFQDLLDEWAMDYEAEYGYPEMTKDIRCKLSDEEKETWDENEDEIRDWLTEHVGWHYPEDHFNNSVKVNIMVDTGDGNYDFTKNNILNWYGTSGGYGCNGEIEEESSILWLAKQQKKATKLRKECRKAYTGRKCESGDKFVESVIQELENISSHMSTLTFLVSMDLFELFDLKKVIEAERKDMPDKYHPQNCETKGTITISKDTMCGLFDPWRGGGSVLEIELDKDVVLPIKYIWKANVEKRGGSWNYGIDEVYGLCSSAWSGTVKEVRSVA